MKLLVTGLGNAEKKYAHTRHNIGFDVVMAFILHHGSRLTEERYAYRGAVHWNGHVFICICPTTYMNESGTAVKYWMENEGVSTENLLVILDDLSIPIERIRIRAGGGPGGHNGLKSIETALGTECYPRLRFGIGSHFPAGMQSGFVLSPWRKEEIPLVKAKIGHCIEAIELMAEAGIAAVMNKFNA
jgi:PTH1 family peptidyl-tRNA hydrolase